MSENAARTPQPHVAVGLYEAPGVSVRRLVESIDGLAGLPGSARVFIKPNIVFWTKAVDFPKWGVITTSRVMQDMVELLVAHGISDITIGEGTVLMDPRDTETPRHAFASLGYDVLAQRYGVKVINVMARPFQKIELAANIMLRFNQDCLESDFVVNLPVMKTHNQTRVSLGIKNLKGLIDLDSRKRCHSMTPGCDLNVMVSHLADPLPPILTLIDGIYTNERGPGFDGRMSRSNLLVASRDILAADMVGATLLGHAPVDVPHLACAAQRQCRSLSLDSLRITGAEHLSRARWHEYDFTYADTDDGTLPLPLVKAGLAGLSYHKYDLSMCTYCSLLNGLILTAIRNAWQNQPWDDVEVLTGKAMQPTPGKKTTILLGKCMVQAHKHNPAIRRLLAVKSCPPKTQQIVEVFQAAGVAVDPGLFEKMDHLPGFFMQRYANRPEFDPEHFCIR